MNEKLSGIDQILKVQSNLKTDRKSPDFKAVQNKLAVLETKEKEDGLIEASIQFANLIPSLTANEILEAFKSNESFAQQPNLLLDLSANSVEVFVLKYLESKKLEIKKVEGTKLLQTARRLENRADELKAEGRSNIEVLAQVLKDHEGGDLSLPIDKLKLYRSFIDLSTNRQFGQDRQVITTIINQSPIDFDDPNSFELVIQKIYSSNRVGQFTKLVIEKHFGIPQIRNGAQLREAVTFREKLHAEYLTAIGKIDTNLGNLKSEIVELEIALKELQKTIIDSPTFDEQFELENQRDELRKHYENLIALQLQLESEKGEIKENLSPKDVILLNGRVKKKENEFVVLMPNGEAYGLPESFGNDEIAETANSYFIWQAMDKLGLAQTLFPEEDLNQDRLPSTSFTLFVNSFLGKFHLSNYGRLLTLGQLDYASQTLAAFRSRKSLDNKELSKEEGARIDLETLGILSNDQVDYLTLGEELERLSLMDNNRAISLFGDSS